MCAHKAWFSLPNIWFNQLVQRGELSWERLIYLKKWFLLKKILWYPPVDCRPTPTPKRQGRIMLPLECFLDILPRTSKIKLQMKYRATETAFAAKGQIMRSLQVQISHRQFRNTFMPSATHRPIPIYNRRSQSTPIRPQQSKLHFQRIQTNTLRSISGIGRTRMRTYRTESRWAILIIFSPRMD